MAGEVFNVFLGGDALKFPWENWLDNNKSDPNGWHTYASHLKRTHFTVPFHFDRFSDYWNKWFVESDMTDLEVGQGLGINLLAAGSLIRETVVHVKKPLPGTKIKVQLMGKAADEPADVTALVAAVSEARKAYETAVSEANAAPDDASKKTAVKDAKKALDAADKAHDDATSTLIEEHEVDFSKAGFYRFKTDKFLQTNGMVNAILTEGTLANACFSVMIEVNNFDDQHGCSCGVIPCDTMYPDALCNPN